MTDLKNTDRGFEKYWSIRKSCVDYKSFWVGACLDWTLNWRLLKSKRTKAKNVRQVNVSQKLQNSFQNSFQTESKKSFFPFCSDYNNFFLKTGHLWAFN